MDLKLATYNIHSCIGTDRRYDPDRIGGVLEELDADVVALQEVESPRDGSPDILFDLAENAGYQVIEGATLRRPKAHYGNAVLTRLPVTRVNHINLSVAWHEPRGALDLHLSTSGYELQLVATHLGLWPGERRYQTRELISLLRPDRAHASILMGDLNEWFLWGRPLRWLHKCFPESPAPRSFPSRRPLFALDRIWVNPRSALRAIDAHCTPLSLLASDHLPVYARLRLTD